LGHLLNSFEEGSALDLALESKALVKVYGNIKALDNLTFKVEQGEIYGLIGPNGAGKTTALRILSTLILPTSGSAVIFGHDVVREAVEVRRLIGYLPGEAGAYKNLSGYEYLQFMGYFSENEDNLVQLVEDAAKISGLGERLKDRVKTYSTGMKRRLLVARALMNKPKLAVLDEPTSGLDVLHAYHVRGIIKQYAKEYGVTVLLSSHNMLEVEHICDTVGLINKGRLVAEGTPAELKTEHNAANLEEVFAEVAGFA
jgi:ABC-2 type transport system ATP-binding protein